MQALKSIFMIFFAKKRKLMELCAHIDVLS